MADYAENGWIVVEGVFDQARMDAVASLASECCRREAAGEELRLNGLPAQPVDPELTHKIKASLSDRGLNGQLLPRKLDAPITKDRRFGAVAADPELRMLAASCLGCDPSEAVVLTDQLFMKPPKIGTAKPYHQDNFYFGLSDSANLVTCWIALEDADEGNGCLRYIDGSHDGGIVDHICTDVDEPYNLNADPAAVIAASAQGQKERLAEVKKGGVIFHHGATLHCSGRNTSERWRRGYAVVYGAAAGFRFDCPDRSLKNTAYCAQPWYATLGGGASGGDLVAVGNGGPGAKFDRPGWFTALLASSSAAAESSNPDPRLQPPRPDRQAPDLVEVAPMLEVDDSGFELIDAMAKTSEPEHLGTARHTVGANLPEKEPPSSSYKPTAGSALDMLQGLLGSAELDIVGAGPIHGDCR